MNENNIEASGAASAQSARIGQSAQAKTLVLFNFDWDLAGFDRWANQFPHDSAGFDLFSFPSNTRLALFDLERYVGRLAGRARRAGWRAVVSNHEQYGALTAALLAERMGWPGTPVNAVLACQHKLHARRILQAVCPQANVSLFAPLAARYGESVPDGLTYPLFVKPIKASFSVLARSVANRDQLQALTRFGRWELWVIRHLVEPFDRIARARLPEAGTAHSMLIEQPAIGRQYNLDGYVFDGRLQEIGFVESMMYPGTQAFMRFAYPCQIAREAREQALDVARRFLAAVGFTHGLFNLEFFYDETSAKLTVIEFNPRMAAQFSDLYLRVAGLDLHRVALELAYGRDPACIPRSKPTAGAAASFVYRAFDPGCAPAMPTPARRREFARCFPDGLLFAFPKSRGSIARDFKWVGSYRYGIVHLGGRDSRDLRLRCEQASDLLGWPAPYLDHQPEAEAMQLVAEPMAAYSAETSS